MEHEATGRVVEVTDRDFERTVIEGSRERPVVVDFWAGWCAPCRQLGPILERLADEKGGEFLLAKLDVDANQTTAAQFGIRSIPTVIAFVEGRPVDSFMGAMPEPAVRQWLDRLLPTEADREAAEALAAEREGRGEEAERLYREAVDQEPDNRAARLGLARVLLRRGAADEARELASALLPDPEAERLLAVIRVDGWRDAAGDGPVARGRLAAAQGRWREALDELIAAVREEEQHRAEARQSVLDVFAVLGDEDPITREYRPRLANALF
ncbi:MAG: thioredoxin [Actinobacteria bacterium]|nr:thioredoxin [Actinomycetota bacterium]